MEYKLHRKWARFRDHWDQQLSLVLDQAMLYPSIAFQGASEETSTVDESFISQSATRCRDAVTEKRLQICMETVAMVSGSLLRICCCVFSLLLPCSGTLKMERGGRGPSYQQLKLGLWEKTEQTGKGFKIHKGGKFEF